MSPLYNPFLSLNLLLHIFHYSYNLLLKALSSFWFPCILLFLSTSLCFSAAFSSGWKRTSRHKSAPLLLLRRENEEKRAGRGNTRDVGREKNIRKRGGGISNLRVLLQNPMNRWIKWKEEREGVWEGLRMSPLMRIIYSSEANRLKTSR